MATSYATKYADAALMTYKAAALTDVFAPKYDWTGAKTVTVFTNATAAMGDYSRTGGFGTPTYVSNTKDDLLLSKDRSFAGLIDKMDNDETNGTLAAGQWLNQQIRNILVPEVDTYNLAAFSTACPTAQVTTGTVTSANAYSTFLTLQGKMHDNEVPVQGRIGFVTPDYYNLIKQDTAFVKASDLGQTMLRNGQVGQVDGVDIVMVPSGRMPTNHKIIIAHQDAVAAPIKLADGTIGEDALYSGWIVTGRFVYDCFVLDQLVNGIALHKSS